MYTCKIVSTYLKEDDIPTTGYAAPPEEGCFHIFVKNIETWTTYVVQVTTDCTMEMLKSLLGPVSKADMRLTWAGHDLNDSHTLESCKITHEATLFLW